MCSRFLDRQVVLYWYHGRGRVTADENANKAFLMVDAARLHRTNGASLAALLFVHLDGYPP